MAADETCSVEYPDVAPQYKAMVDYYTLAIMDAAKDLMALVEELGCDSYQCANETYIVVIERTKDAKGKPDGGDSSVED